VNYWCEQAWLGGERASDGVLITVDGERINRVDTDVPAPPAGTTRLDGLTLPGFANAHSHAFHRALRGRTHSGDGTFWTWRDRMYELAGSLDPDTYEELATATFAEMVLAGYTCVGEFHYLHHGRDGEPYGHPNEIGLRLMAAARRAGIRITLLDTCYLAGGIGTPVNAVQARFSDGSAERWAERVDELRASESSRCRVGAAIHSVRAVDADSIRVVAAWAAEHGSVLHAHVSEQPQENADCLEAYGCTPVELLSRNDVLGERFTAIHATHATDSDIALMTTARSRCCICATTERELADGIGPTAALRDAGVALCIGSDSHAVVDPFEEARAIELDERLASLRRGTHQPADLLRAATESGYASLGWNDGGVLVDGSLADFVRVDLENPRLAGSAREDAPAAVVFAAAPVDVRDVVVGGEHVVRDGEHRTLDVTATLAESIDTAWDRAEL
jgi:formiminoglutamate deiminase